LEISIDFVRDLHDGFKVIALPAGNIYYQQPVAGFGILHVHGENG
jgi:hypothetical protein